MLLALVGQERRQPTGLRHMQFPVDLARLRRLITLGAPAAGQIALEVAVFTTATALAAKLDPLALAAHQIVLNVASMTFMVPLGIASAGAVRVGQAIGRRDARGAERSGWTALMLGAGFMAAAAVGFVGVPEEIVRLFTTDESVVRIGVTLLFVAAIFQLFDGVQVVATGILRGLGDTRTPMLSSLAGHWLIGLPVGYALCFLWDVGVAGLWVGLSLGLILVGSVLLVIWRQRVGRLRQDLPRSMASVSI
jgi:MATE family multidrug resistance protein